MRYKVDFEKMYSEYLSQFSASKKYAKSRGGKVRIIGGVEVTPSSFSEFKVDLRSAMSDNPKKGPKALSQQLAKDEVYETSAEQAKKRAEVYEKLTGKEVTLATITKFRIGNDEDLWTLIKEQRKQLKEEQPGLSTYRINLLIGQEFFGSD